MEDTGVDQSWFAWTAQLLVLLVNSATVETGVDQSWKALEAQLLVLLVNSAIVLV
jgi:hypothetical protein